MQVCVFHSDGVASSAGGGNPFTASQTEEGTIYIHNVLLVQEYPQR